MNLTCAKLHKIDEVPKFLDDKDELTGYLADIKGTGYDCLKTKMFKC